MKNKENQSNNLESYADLYSTGASSASTAIAEGQETNLNLFPDLILDDSNGNLTIVINHDYYSSDSEHGRELLGAFLDILADEFSKVSRIFLIDKGVKLLDQSNKLYSAFKTLDDLEFSIVCCRESIDEYGIEFTKKNNNELLSMHDIALELMSVPYLFTLS